MTKLNEELFVVLFAVKPRAKTPPVGASWLICERASDESVVFTRAPESADVAGCSRCERESKAVTSGS